MIEVLEFAYTARFERDLRKAEPTVQSAARAALEQLQRNPEAKALRLHPLQGYGKPTVWKIDVLTNRSWQITFELEAGGVARLCRLAPHGVIDRAPRA